MIHDGSKAKHEPTGGTTAEEQLRPPHTAAGATPRAGQAPQAHGQTRGQPDWSFKFVVKGRPTSPRRYHTSPQLSAPFPIEHVVVVDEQLRQSDALEEGNKAERDSFKHILKFSSTYF